MVQRKRKNKVLRESLHQVRRAGTPKRAKDLVQRKRKNKVLRESLHQVRRAGAPKRAKDLVQGKRRNKVLRGFVHQVRSRRAAHHRNPTPQILRSARLRPRTLVSRNGRSRCTKCTAASSIYYALFWGCKFKGEAHAVRQRPAGPAAPRKSGSALPTRRSPHRPAAPRPRGEARTACASYAYIGRLGMRTVKVVPLPGMLST